MAMVSGNKGAVSHINVTPLIDVLLVLLIIFMVILPAKPKGLQTLAPQNSSSPGKSEPNTIIVQIVSHGQSPASYKINQEDLPKAEIESKLTQIFAARQDKLMFVKGDTNLTYDQVAEVIDMGHHVGVHDVGILTPAMTVAR